MKVRNVEGLASHNGPESCVGDGNVAGEALTGERTGQVLSREIPELRGADAVEQGGRPHATRRPREARRDPARSKTLCTYGSTATGNREVLRFSPATSAGERVGKSKDPRR